MKTQYIRPIIVLSLGLTMALALTFALAAGAALGAPLMQDQPDGSTIVSPQTTSGVWGPGVITATSNVVINAGVVITIAPNTTIRVAGNYGFTVNGDLHSDGPATFTAVSATPGAWQGITYASGSRGYLNQVTVEYAQHALVLNTANPITISNSTLRYNRHAPAANQMAYGAGLYLQQGNHLIQDTHIYSNTAVATGSGQVRGAGVYIAAGSPTIRNSWVHENIASGNVAGAGGGVSIAAGGARIESSYVLSNTITGGGNNQLKSGGGIGFVAATSAVITDTWISGNRNVPTDGYAGGGGIAFDGDASASLIWGCVIHNNYALGPDHCEGGGIDTWSTGDSITIANSLIISNAVGATCGSGAGSRIGGGMNMNGSSAGARVINSTIVGNQAGQGGGLYLQGGTVFALNNIVVQNSASNQGGGVYRGAGTVNYNDIYSNTAPTGPNTQGAMGANNIFVDPLFVDTGDIPLKYHVRQGSPAIDAVATADPRSPNDDYDHQPRPLGARYDMGFDEVLPFTYTKSVDLVKGSGGYPLVYTIVVANPDPNAFLASGRITDAMPINTTYTPSVACSLGACSYDDGTQSVTWTGDVPPQSSLTLNYTVTVNTGLANGDQITNTAFVTVGAKGGWTNAVTTVIFDPPLADGDSYSTDEDATLNVPAATGLLTDDVRYNGNPLTAILVANPTNGAVTLNADGSFVYTPTADYHGADSFTYKANDGVADSNIVAVSITVNSVVDTPSVTDATTNEDTQTTSGLVISRHPVDGGEVTHFKITAITNGTLYQNDGTTVINDGDFITYAQGNAGLRFTPAANFTGAATLVVQASASASDAGLGGDLATATIAVNPINDPPDAVDDTYATNEDVPLTIAASGVLGNDTDVDHDPLMAILVTGPANGALEFSADGGFSYTPPADYHGADTFTYKARDSAADSNIAAVTITVHSLNDAPVALDDNYSATQDTELSVDAPGVLGNDSDADGDSLTAARLDGPAHGALVLRQDGSFVYTPTASYIGPDSFTYQTNDGVADSTVATVTLSVLVKNYPVYLPFISKAPTVTGPDLIVVSANATSSDVTVVIKNQGDAPVLAENEFWVDLYIQPSPVPTGVNQIWSDGRSLQGVVWGVSGSALPLDPGESLTLTLGDMYYWPSYSYYAGSLPAGTPIYVQVDSYNADTTFGAVLESHEVGSGDYNNILGPVHSTAMGGPVKPASLPPASRHNLPPRP